MIICVCANYSDSEIESEISIGTDSLEKLQSIGVCANCKSCEKQVIDILNNKLSSD